MARTAKSFESKMAAGAKPVIEGGKKNVAISKMIADASAKGNTRSTKKAIGRR